MTHDHENSINKSSVNMNTKSKINGFGCKLALLAILILPEIADAQLFSYNPYGDVLAGFRKTGSFAGNYELVVDLGNVTNFLAVPAGTTINITNYSTVQITNAFTDTGSFQNLQWSVFADFPNSNPWTNAFGIFPQATLWYTLPGTNVSVQTQPPARRALGSQKATRTQVSGVGPGAVAIAGFLNVTNINNNAFLVREPVAYYANNDTLSSFIGNFDDVVDGNFGAGNSPLPYDVENTTPNPFSSPQRDDFYQFVPTGSTDPLTGSTTGNAYFVGYFILNPNGSETFTRAAAVTAPTITSVSGSATNGFSPLQVVFTNSASGTITDWIWNFGNGTIITNTTGGSVTNVYAAQGNYTVTLTVVGPAGSSTNILANYIVTSPTPTLGNVVLSGGKLTIGGTNGPVGVQYRIFESTNLTTWAPVFTNTIGATGNYNYTNSYSGTKAFFRLTSP
jgi:PKD repeat protein